MWRFFRRRKGRITKLICLVCILGVIIRAKHYIANDTKDKKKLKSNFFAQRLETLDQEKQRLHNFLNQIKMVCKVAKSVGEESMTLPLCMETKTGTKLNQAFTLISVESKNLQFEIQVQNTWKNATVLIMPPGVHTEQIVYQNLFDILTNFSREANHILLKLSSDTVKPSFITKLIRDNFLENVHLVYIYLHLKANRDVIYDWYSALVSLKLTSEFALYYVSNNLKKCFLDLEKLDCVISTGWLKKLRNELFIPELKASDTDQAEMVFKLLSKSQNCSLIDYFYRNTPSNSRAISNSVSYIRPNRWPICISHVSKPCVAYVAKFGFNYIENLLKQSCSVHVFDPTFYENSTHNLLYHQWSFARVSSSLESAVNSSQQNWVFKKPSETLVQLGHENVTIDILHLDLHGGEWEVIQEMISNHALNNVLQIIATVHVWYGEEYFNYISQFLALNQLRDLGFAIYFVEPMTDLSNFPDHQNPTEKCCFTVGWIKL